MATIIQFPDSISFLENLKAVRIASSETVAFKLSSGGSTILEETYSPGPSGIIEIGLRDVISGLISLEYPDSDVFAQPSAVARLSVTVDDGAAQDFTVLSGGVRGLSTTAESFIRANWLTWQPQTKTVRWDQPEHLSYYSAVSGAIMAKFYLKNGGTETVTLHTVTTVAGMATYRTQMSTVFAHSSHPVEELYGLVDIWYQTAGITYTYVQRYVCTPETRDEHYFACVNSLGGIDTFCFTGARSLSPAVEHSSARRDERKVDVTPEPERAWTQGTGHLDAAESKWIWDFFNSPRHWAVIDGDLEEIVIDSSSIRASDDENLNAFDFSFSPVKTGRTMKIDRTAGQLPPMEVPSPAGDLFFLAPRIVDYPDAAIDDSLLLLVQSPLAQEWRKMGVGALFNYLSEKIRLTEWGQLAHTHGNKAVLDAFSISLSGKLLFNGQEVGGALVPATAETLGGVKIGQGVNVDADGTISVDNGNAKPIFRIRIVRAEDAWALDESEMTGQQMAMALGSGDYQGVILVADSGNASPQYPAELLFTAVGHAIVTVMTHELTNGSIAQKKYEVQLDGQAAATVSVTESSLGDTKSFLRIRIAKTGTAWSLDESKMTGQQMAEALGSDVYQGVILVADSGNASPQYPAEVEYTGVGHVVVSVNTHELENGGIAQRRYEVALDMQAAATVTVTDTGSRIDPILIPLEIISGTNYGIIGGQTKAKAIHDDVASHPGIPVCVTLGGGIHPVRNINQDIGNQYIFYAPFDLLNVSDKTEELRIEISVNGEYAVTVESIYPAGTNTRGLVSIGNNISYNAVTGTISVPNASMNTPGVVKPGPGMTVDAVTGTMDVRHGYYFFDVSLSFLPKIYPATDFSAFMALRSDSAKPVVYIHNGKELPAEILFDPSNSQVIITATELTPDGSGGLAWTHHKVVWNENAMTYTSENGTI